MISFHLLLRRASVHAHIEKSTMASCSIASNCMFFSSRRQSLGATCSSSSSSSSSFARGVRKGALRCPTLKRRGRRASSTGNVFAVLSEEDNRAQISDCQKYVSDLKQMNVKLPLIRRYVAGTKNVEGAAKLSRHVGWRARRGRRRRGREATENVLVLLNDLRLEKAEEEQFWLE